MSEGITNKEQYPAVEGLFTWPTDDPHLIGGRCKSCGTYFFPKFYVVHKPDCKDGEVEEVLLSKRGKLESYTVMYYPSPPPFVNSDPFAPWAVGLVILPEGIKVLGILTGCKLDELKTNINVEVVVEKLYEDEGGSEALGWKFRPV